VAGTVESMHPGILRVSHSEYRDLNPVWKETDERGEDYPVKDVRKGSVGLYQPASSLSGERNTDRRQSCGLTFPGSGEGTTAPRLTGLVWATGRLFLTLAPIRG